MNKSIKKIRKIVLLAFAIPFFIVSCSDDDNNHVRVPQGNYDNNGVFVLNEGGFGPSTASISFITENGTVEHDIFRTVNPNAEEIGSFLQNIFFDDTRAFIISGQASTITVVNRYTFEYIATIIAPENSNDILNPRYGVTSKGKAFVTNGGDFSSTGGFVTVIDLSNYSILKTIPLNTITERIIEEDGKVYVSNGGAFGGGGSTITVIDAQSTNVETTINLGEGHIPSTIDEEDNFLYVLTKKDLKKINMGTNQITSQKVLHDSIFAPNHLTIENDVIYFTNSTSVYSLPLQDFDNSNVAPNHVLTYQSNSQYGAMYGFAVKDQKIYVAEGGDFVSDSEVYIYSLNGTLQNTHTVGVGPNGFYFND